MEVKNHWAAPQHKDRLHNRTLKSTEPFLIALLTLLTNADTASLCFTLIQVKLDPTLYYWKTSDLQPIAFSQRSVHSCWHTQTHIQETTAWSAGILSHYNSIYKYIYCATWHVLLSCSLFSLVQLFKHKIQHD